MISQRNKGMRKRRMPVWIALFWAVVLAGVTMAPASSAMRTGGGGGGGPPPPTVPLGVDTYWYSADWGDRATGMSGLGCTRYLGAGYDVPNMRALVNTWAILSGFCTLEARAEVGHTFLVTGSGSMFANIRMNGHYEGDVRAVLAASASATIELHVKDTTAGTEWSTVIANPSCAAACSWSANTDFDKSLVVKLDAGHWYLVFLHIYAKATIAALFPVIGEGKVDFGPYDDDSAGGSSYRWFLVDF